MKTGSLKTVQLLLDPQFPSTLEEKDVDNNTPLHIACRHGRLDILRVLLDQDANVTAPNKKNMTCLDVAIEWGSNAAAKSLIKHKRFVENFL